MKKIFLGLMTFCSISIYAQDVISSQGDSYKNSEGEIDFTIGETVIETIGDGETDLTQGFHQPKLSVEGVEDLKKDLIVKVFPNPTAKRITIQLDQLEKLNYQIVDATGKLIAEKQITSKNENFDFSEYSNGNYVLKIFDIENSPIKTFNIIKNQ